MFRLKLASICCFALVDFLVAEEAEAPTNETEGGDVQTCKKSHECDSGCCAFDSQRISWKLVKDTAECKAMKLKCFGNISISTVDTAHLEAHVKKCADEFPGCGGKICQPQKECLKQGGIVVGVIIGVIVLLVCLACVMKYVCCGKAQGRMTVAPEEESLYESLHSEEHVQ
eukprot:TRINITY_DN56555_c0_g1_i1.p2 TRINITY_DN56555_c0_g1~~TRINITY_DN56555_c0_g1_i1.p2  ORF type:complete len:171 (+),score=30.42 TRINITY_DN56555_c0_g1_i1:123-635(+)